MKWRYRGEERGEPMRTPLVFPAVPPCSPVACYLWRDSLVIEGDTVRGPIAVVILAICALMGVGGALFVIPGRMTRLLNDAFVIVPKVEGRYPLVRRAIAMLVGVVLISYGVMIAWDFFVAARFFTDPGSR